VTAETNDGHDKAAPQTAAMDEQRHVRTKHFFVWEQDDSIMSQKWRGLSQTCQILWRNFKGTLKEL
jgi:hypothetical protein